MQFRRQGRPEVSINIAPIVDIVFILVIFFAVSTTFLETAGLKLDLPRSTSTAERQQEDLTVVLSADGAISFAGEQLERSGLKQRLSEALEASTVRRVVLRADGNARHADVVAVMDAIRDAGAETLTVAARPAATP
jgi:biopolymer transport protein ExbD